MHKNRSFIFSKTIVFPMDYPEKLIKQTNKQRGDCEFKKNKINCHFHLAETLDRWINSVHRRQRKSDSSCHLEDKIDKENLKYFSSKNIREIILEEGFKICF